MRTAIGIMLFLLAIPNPLMAQFVYFSPTGGCSVDGTGCMNYFTEFYVFIYAENVLNSTGTSFYIEGDEYTLFGTDNVLSVEPHDSVVIENGNLFSGITLSWLEGQFSYDTLLTIKLNPDNMPLFNWMVFTKDIDLYIANGAPLHLDDFMFYCSHCTGLAGGTIWWQHADTLTAVIGEQSTLDLPCIGSSGGGLSGTYLDAYDDFGWIDECVDCSVSIDCGPCPWHVQHVLLNITVPSVVEEGTINKIRILPTGPCCLDDSTSVYVKAVSKIGTEETSWGSIKKLLKNN